jgi:hypothetical protein
MCGIAGYFASEEISIREGQELISRMLAALTHRGPDGQGRYVDPHCGLACTRLADAGVPLGSQTVLLSGVNDNVETMKKLVHRLLMMRVRPYYLYQCDPISGSAHFRTPVEKGLEIIQSLRGFTSGYAVPTYVIDAPGGGGKIPLLPQYVLGRNGKDIILRNYKYEIYTYPDVEEEQPEPQLVVETKYRRRRRMTEKKVYANEPSKRELEPVGK